MKRPYELKRRAVRQAETRRRILEATVALHTSVGPAATSIKAIAELAGVERHTVYAHFPEERSLFDACTAHCYVRHPFPDLASSLSIPDPERRLRRTLDSVYGWYEANERDLEPLRLDAAVHQLRPSTWAPSIATWPASRRSSPSHSGAVVACARRPGTLSRSRRGSR